MDPRPRLEMSPQPDKRTCGLSCLQSVYGYFDKRIDVCVLARAVPLIGGGGTWAVSLAVDALRRGFDVTLCVLSPTSAAKAACRDPAERRPVFASSAVPAIDLHAQYTRFFELGGRLIYESFSWSNAARLLERNGPLILGVRVPDLYRSPGRSDALAFCSRNGSWRHAHFIVLSAFNSECGTAEIWDPCPNDRTGLCRPSIMPAADLERAVEASLDELDAHILAVRPKPEARLILPVPAAVSA